MDRKLEREELKKIITLAKALWSSFNVPTEKLDIMAMLGVWYEQLEPYSFETVKTAMIEHAKESDFLNIAKVADKCFNAVTKNLPEFDAGQIFLEIKRATDYYNCKEKFARLSPVAKAVVVDPSQLATWALIPGTEVVVLESLLRKRIQSNLENYKFNLAVENKIPQIVEEAQRRVESSIPQQIEFQNKGDK